MYIAAQAKKVGRNTDEILHAIDQASIETAEAKKALPAEPDRNPPLPAHDQNLIAGWCPGSS